LEEEIKPFGIAMVLFALEITELEEKPSQGIISHTAVTAADFNPSG